MSVGVEIEGPSEARVIVEMSWSVAEALLDDLAESRNPRTKPLRTSLFRVVGRAVITRERTDKQPVLVSAA